MDTFAYHSLQYGNVIQRDSDGKKFMVIRTNRQANGDCKAAALAPCIQEADAAGYSILANDKAETLLTGRTIQGE